MRRSIVRWLPALALVAAPGFLAAQGGAPDAAAGAGVFRWEDGSRDVSGEAHIGVDLRSGRMGVRLEARLEPHAGPGLVAGIVLAPSSR